MIYKEPHGPLFIGKDGLSFGAPGIVETTTEGLVKNRSNFRPGFGLSGNYKGYIPKVWSKDS